MERTQQTAYDAGPSLLTLAIVYTLLVAASIISGLLLKHGLAVINPYSPAEEARRFFSENPLALRVSSFFLFGSSVPLGIYAATVVSRLRFLGVRAAGAYIALGGGFAASGSLANASWYFGSIVQRSRKRFMCDTSLMYSAGTSDRSPSKR